MHSQPVSPNLDVTLPPRFHEMGEYRFQRFVTDLYAYEPDIATSSEYGVRGQADDGADVIARRNRGDGQEVASCKCYQQASPKQIREWSDEFLEHWEEHWQGQDIRRFVLATTALNAASRSIQDQVTRERERFAALGVTYDFWAPATLVSKIRPHRSLAVTYLGVGWADQICGQTVELGLATSSSAGLVSAALIGQVAELQAKLSAQALQAAERAQEDLRVGRTDTVRALIMEQREEETWRQLDGRAQAKLLRLAASLALVDQDVAEAERLSAAADALAPQDEPRLAAHIALKNGGPDVALAILGDVASAAGLQLRATLRVMAGDLTGAKADLARLLQIDSEDPESMRVEALVALASGEPNSALRHMHRTEALAPDRNAVRQLGAIARYACALSPAITPEWYLSPNAFDGSFVRQDAHSQGLLDEALSLLDRVVATEPDALHSRVWRLAVLASMRSRRERARNEAADLLQRSDHDPTVVAWCIFRAIEVDLLPSEQKLIERYSAGTDQTSVQVLGLLLMRREDAAASASLLRSALDRQPTETRKEAEIWIARLEGSWGETQAPGTDPASTFARGRINGNWGPASARLRELLSTVPPDPAALGLAEGLASEDQFALLAPHVDAILEFRTAAAVRLAAFIAYRSGNSARVLTILDEEAAEFGEALPPDMRRLRADALARTGNIPAALREADVVASSGLPKDRLFRAELMSSTGNVKGTIAAVREALDAGLLRGNAAFQWSRMMRTEEPALARRLLKQAIETDLDDQLVAAAMQDAYSLELRAQGDALMARVHARAISGADDVRLLTSEDIPALIAEQQARAAETEQMYQDGVIPVHLLLAHDPVAFAILYLGPNVAPDGSIRPWPIRHGARPPAVEYDLPWSAWHLHVDISALLVATRLDLLEALESHPNGVSIPADAPLALLAMETGCRQRSDARIAECILASELTPVGLDDAATIAIVSGEVGTNETRRLSLRALVEGLAKRRALDAATAVQITEGLPEHVAFDMPEDGSVLLLDSNSVQRLAAFDALSILARWYDLRCNGSLLDQASRVQKDAAVALNTAEVLSQLRARISVGLEAGTYRLIPRSSSDDDDERETLAANTQISRCLADTISIAGPEGSIAWVDDRMVTGYARTGTMHVVGICDVLEALAREGRITRARQYAAHATLRAAGALFLVPTSEEILAALIPAPHQGQQIVETPDLVAMRRSLALLALHERNLSIGGNAMEGRPDEVVPLQKAMRLLSNCLREVWLDNSLSHDQRVAFSDWLWLNARRTHVGRVLAAEDRPTSQDTFEVMQIAHCLDQAADIGSAKDARRHARQDYLQWLWLRAVEPLSTADPSFLNRLSRYLANFYTEILRAEDVQRLRDRRVLNILIGRRIQLLPVSLQTELYRDPRLHAFGSIQEVITIGAATFSSDVFWRAVRRALKYGVARLRTQPGKRRSGRVTLRRSGHGVVASGAVRARIGDDMLMISALDGPERAAEIDRVVADLQIAPGLAEDIAAEAKAARTAAATIRVLRKASNDSAASRYRMVAGKLARHERVPLDTFAPAPMPAVLAAMGITDMTLPFRDALDSARRTRDASDLLKGFIENAGIPVLRPEHDLIALTSPDIAARAQTPMAIIHVAAAARAVGRPSQDIATLCERLATSVEQNGRLFIELLHWTHRHFIRDPLWRKAPPAYALAAIWSHADRTLDLVVGLEPDGLRRTLRASRPEIAGIDLLGLEPGPPDVGWPGWMSAAALLHHGLAAIFGSEDPRNTLSDALVGRLSEAQLFRHTGILAPEVKLLLRRDDWPNSMGSFLAGSAVGFECGTFDRAGTRSTLIESALGAIQANRADAAAWLQLGAFANGGLDTSSYETLLGLISEDPGQLVRLTAAGTNRVIWRALLQPIAWRDVSEATRLARELSVACRRWHDAQAFVTESPIAPTAAAEELLELAAIAASCAGSDGPSVFADMVYGCARAWPALRPILHQAVGNIVARTPSGRADALWTLLNRLGSL